MSKRCWGALDADKALVDQLKPAFSRPWAPNWQDHSTQAECDEFDAQARDAGEAGRGYGQLCPPRE